MPLTYHIDSVSGMLLETLTDSGPLDVGVFKDRRAALGWRSATKDHRGRVTVLEPTTSTGHPWRAAVTCPTLAAWGSDGDVLSEAQARGMVETLPGGELVRVPGVGHAPALVEPAVVAALECFSPHPPGVPEKTRRSSRFSRYR